MQTSREVWKELKHILADCVRCHVDVVDAVREITIRCSVSNILSVSTLRYLVKLHYLKFKNAIERCPSFRVGGLLEFRTERHKE